MPQIGLTPKGLFLTLITCQYRWAGILIYLVAQRPRLTLGCTGALHSLNSEVMSLSPLITSCQNALAQTSNMAMPYCQRAGKCCLLCV